MKPPKRKGFKNTLAFAFDRQLSAAKAFFMVYKEDIG